MHILQSQLLKLGCCKTKSAVSLKREEEEVVLPIVKKYSKAKLT